MAEEINPLGNINVTNRAIATIAYQATVESYGVVGLAAKNMVDGLANRIVKDPTHGIDVTHVDGNIIIDVYVIVQYGTRIKTVAAEVADTVRYNVEKSLGLPIYEVNVHVQGLRVNGEE